MNKTKNECQSFVDLPGGEAFFETLAGEIAHATQTESSVSVALVDLDQLACVNDQYGIDTGDAVLQMVAQRLQDLEIIEKYIFRHNVRAGGDEFVILLPGMEKEDAFLLLEKERAAFATERELVVKGKKVVIPLAFSSGIATYPEDGIRPQDVVRKASDALYRAKATGSNKVCLAREERMVTKTSHYTPAQLARLSNIAKREGVGEAVLLREALDELLRKYEK
jgi:diguanylate cyclase (GGDEF)-like protein